MTDHDRKTLEACQRLKAQASSMSDEMRDDIYYVTASFEVLLKCWNAVMEINPKTEGKA